MTDLIFNQVTILVWAGMWFPVAVWFARTWKTDRCPESCRYIDNGAGYLSRVYHAEECKTNPLMIHPGTACVIALLWPVLLPYKAVEAAANYERKPRMMTDAQLAALEQECEIFNREAFGR